MSKKSRKAVAASGSPFALAALLGSTGAEWIKTLFFALAIALIIRWALVEPFKIPSGSMEPTLHGDPGLGRGDRVFVNKWAYGLRVPFVNKRIWHGKMPERWDVVVFRTVEKKNPEAKELVKRIVGLPGERIHVGEDGNIYVNGQAVPLPESMPPVKYTRDGQFGVIQDDAFSKVPEGHYLVMGDNSGHSRDGRFWGFLPNEHILGRVFCIWWPPASWRDFTGFTATWWWRMLVGALGALGAARLFLGRFWRAPRAFSSETLAPDDLVWINRAALGIPLPFSSKRIGPVRRPKRGALIVCRLAGKSGEKDGLVVGRAVAFGGEEVVLDNGVPLVNGTPLSDAPFLCERRWESSAGPYGKSKSKQYAQVPEGKLFVLSDGPSSGPDSRTLGWIALENVIGVVSCVCWPPRRWKRIRR
ncbi:MAG TPA: signal peptidase I [Candidatus Hydrogenedentes bacterium]|nr:signal peptidase I [Candidatus Hydrogenedentota bacterium]